MLNGRATAPVPLPIAKPVSTATQLGLFSDIDLPSGSGLGA
jgi:hypothetical protein